MSSRIPHRGTGHSGRFNGPLRHTLAQWPHAQEADARIEKRTQIPGRHDESENGTTVAMRLSSLNSVMFFAVFWYFPLAFFWHLVWRPFSCFRCVSLFFSCFSVCSLAFCLVFLSDFFDAFFAFLVVFGFLLVFLLVFFLAFS